MGREVRLEELQQRAKSFEAHFLGAIEDYRERSERLSSLLDAVEERIVRKESEIKRLSEERARAREDAEQFRAMLGTLLAATEDDCTNGIGSVLPELEHRIQNLVETA